VIRTPKIRTFAPREWSTYKDLRLRSLADSPDAFGRTLAEERDRADAEWSNRLTSATDRNWDLPLMAELDEEAIGLAWGRIERSTPDVANLYQMWVAPDHRRLGAGRMLLEAIIAWARARNVCYLDLGVTCGDNPAIRLYTRAGFERLGEPELLRPGSDLLAQPMRLKLRSGAG
jgi:GNAT superfamily N-acetyltransferase